MGLHHLVGGSTGPQYSLLHFDLQENIKQAKNNASFRGD